MVAKTQDKGGGAGTTETDPMEKGRVHGVLSGRCVVEEEDSQQANAKGRLGCVKLNR